MSDVRIIGIDLAKRYFQLHGASADGSVVFRKKLSRDRLLPFLTDQAPAIVAMEACASAHYWGRKISALGREVRLLPPIYVKPFVKRQKNDAADAEAIAEAAARPTMRFVSVKTAEQQADAMVFRARDLWVHQRTQTVNALRGHLAEFGIVAPADHARVDRLAEAVNDTATTMPDMARELARMMLAQIEELTARIDGLEKEIRARAPKDSEVARLMTIPGVGAISATAVRAFCPDMRQFRSGRDFAAWIGLTPKQNSTGGKVRLGGISKMGQRDIRRLLIVGASAVVCWAARKGGAPAGSWLSGMMARKPHKLGHDIRLIPASYVKPFVKRQKNDMADAEAICEAAQRPTMRFVALKSEEQQASAVVFRARDILVGNAPSLSTPCAGTWRSMGRWSPRGQATWPG